MDVAAPLEHDLKSWCNTIGMVLILAPAVALSAMHVVIIEGLGGESRYTEQFSEQIAAIESAAQSLTSNGRVRVFRGDEASRDNVLQFFVDLKQLTSKFFP